MAKKEASYVIADKRFRLFRKLLFTDNWAAGRQITFELSVLPAGEYLCYLLFDFYGVFRQDGNGTDAADHMELVNVIDNVEISNGTNTHLRLPMYGVAQDYKMTSGHNPLLPDDIAASTGASNVDTTFAFSIPFVYCNPHLKRCDDTAYPTSLLQDGNLTVRYNADATLTGHASNAMQSGTLAVYAVTARLNRAVIPPEVEVGYVTCDTDDLRLPRGNYFTVWCTALTKTEKLTQTSVYAQADGMDIIAAGTRIDVLEGQIAQDCRWVDSELQIPYHGDVLDKNIPPVATGDVNFHWFPLVSPVFEGKFSKIIRVENLLQFNLTTTGVVTGKKLMYRRYMNHTESGIDARAKVLGFGSGSEAVPRTNRRSLGEGDASLADLLPVRLIQAPPA